jgi:predicted dithiol-disulfide oxidoreductase (DUF899 family)
MTALHDVRFPNESAEYRAARDALLTAELELRRRLEAVAAQRRALPPGGEVPEDYLFDEALDTEGETIRQVRLSELFGDKPTLVAYSLMYGPGSPPCPMCTAMLDSLDGSAGHVGRRAALVVIAKSPIARIRAHANARGWRRLRLLSSAGSTYNRDYRGETAEGRQMPALNLFVHRDGRIRHFWHAELLYLATEPGQHPRHVDAIWPLWNLLDLTPEGRGTDWYPRLDDA